MPTRIRSTVEDHTQIYTWKGFRYGSQIDSVSSTAPAGYSKTIEDSPTPGFFKTCRTGGMLPINKVLISTETQVVTPCEGRLQDPYDPTFYYEGKYWRSQGNHLLGPSILTPAGLEAALGNSALAKARNIPWDALTFAMEAGKTAQLLRSPLKGVTNAANSCLNEAIRLERGQKRSSRYKGKKGFGSILESFNSLWLEGRYGWRPMMYDAEDIITTFHRNMEQKVDILSRGKEDSVLDLIDESVSLFYEASTTGAFEVRTRRTGFKRCVASAFIKATPPAFNRSFSADPFSTAWELVPFSFVIDWFVPVGTWLNALIPQQGQSYEASCYSETLESQLVTDVVPVGNGTWKWTGTDQRYVTTYKIYNRNPSGFPTGPGIRPNLNNLKLVDLAALAIASKTRFANRLLRL